MLAQEQTVQPFKPFGQPAAIPGTTMMINPRVPPPNMYPMGFNQFKHINVPPPVIPPPPSIGADPTMPIVPGIPNTFPGAQQTVDFDARRQQRRNLQRRTVDYNASVVQQIKNRVWRKTSASVPSIQPDVLYYTDLAAPRSLVQNPVNSVTTRFVRTATNKIRCPIFSLSWTPEGRRLITGASSGEFTLWGGLSFNFETVLQAHESAVRTMHWSHNDTWLLSADHSGLVKYWQSNMNNVKTMQAHNDPVRGVGFSPTDNKFATCSDDGTVKIWDFYRCCEERVLRGHGADVKCIDWHPSKGLLVSGSKDSQQPLKLWDPKSGMSLSTIHIHKSTVMDLQWNRNGNWLLTASRDHLIKVFDIRAMKEIQTFKGHKKEATAVDWHPIHESLFVSGGSDGGIFFWNMGSVKDLGSMDHAHDAMIWSVRWHPLGHLVASGSNDHTCKFWTRNRPGDKMKDKYNLNTNPLGDDDYEYDVPVIADATESNTSVDAGKNAAEALPGLSFDTSTAPSSSKLNLESPAIPGIDMNFPSADSIKQQEEKQMLLQKARQSGFKLPNLQQGNDSSLRPDARSFSPRSSSSFKIPSASEVQAILEGRHGNDSGPNAHAASRSGGLLPTPNKDMMIQPPTITKGIFDPLEIEPGFAIDADEVWLNEQLDEEDASLEATAQKGGRREDHRMQHRESFEGMSQDQGGRRRFANRNHDEFQGDIHQRQKDQPGWREPPEKRRALQRPSNFQANENRGIRPPFPPMRGRGQYPSHAWQPFDSRVSNEGQGGSEIRPMGSFQPEPHQQDNVPNNEKDSSVNDGQWKEPNNAESVSRRGFGPSRGRGRGYQNHSLQRQGPRFGRGGSNVRPPFNDSSHGQRTPVEPVMGPPWRMKMAAQPNDRPDRSPDGPQSFKNNDRQDSNFESGQRRGPHPLLRRGRGAALRGGRVPPLFEPRAPRPLGERADNNSHAGKDSPLHERPFSHNEDWRAKQNIPDSIEVPGQNHISEQHQWPIDRTGQRT